MSPLDDSKTVESGGNTEKSVYKLPRIVVLLVIVIIASLVLTIGFSIVQLVYGSPAFGIATTALLGLLGAVSVAFLNGAYFEPKRAEEERKHQRKMASDEREHQRRRDKDKEELEQKKIEAQMAQLRKALYNEMVTVYCTISTYVGYAKALESALYDTPLPSHIVRELVDFSLYESIRENTPLLFWELAEAQTIAAFYTIAQGALEEAAGAESSGMTSYKKAAEFLEGALLRAAVKIVGDANFDVTLLLKCGDVTWKPCIEKLQAQLEDPEKLGEDSRKFDETRLIALLKGSGATASGKEE
jgi:uncharacterized membrane protein